MKHLLTFMLATLFPCIMQATPSTDTALVRLKTFVRNIDNFNRLFPQEKVYLHLDNTGYYMGDSIWYKAYVIRTDSGRPGRLSHVLYVELVDPFGNVLEQQKRPIKDGQAYGNLKMQKSMTDGFYEVRAFTRYMTNWDAAGIFSRVVPVFQRPEKEGEFSQMKIKREFDNFRQATQFVPDSLNRREQRRWRKSMPPLVTFYPEGEQLVRGLQGVVAFEVTRENEANPDVTACLVNQQGDTLSLVRTEREGRGRFTCTPTDERLSLRLIHEGETYSYALPAAADTGCVMTVGLTAGAQIPIEIAASTPLRHTLFGLSLMHNGRVLAFDTLRPDTAPVFRQFDRQSLPAGVHQLTLFDANGRIWAERLFFVAPHEDRDIIRAGATFADSLIAPHRKMRLHIQAPPRTTVSLSVMDADATPTGYHGNAASWFLLSSELKGFVRNAEYYLEADDIAHREAADLLMLVQGWRRYDWEIMSGNAPFVKKQPIEDSLYIYGRVMPRLLYADGLLTPKKRREKLSRVDNIRLSATLFNREGLSMKGRTLTDDNGYYAFSLPDCEGEWMLIFGTRREEKKQDFRPTVDRLFSPEKKLYSFYETELLPLAKPENYFHKNARQFTETAKNPFEINLPLVTVKEEQPFTGKRNWEISRSFVGKYSHIHYNMDEIADAYYDRGERPPFIGTWLFHNPVIVNEYIKGSQFYIYHNLDKVPVIVTPAWKSKNQQFAFRHKKIDQKALDDMLELDIAYVNNSFSLTLDEISEVYVSLDNSTLNHKKLGLPDSYRSIQIYIYPHYTFPVKAKGQRRTYFKGFNRPSTFRMTNYDILPPARDYRRTLYWNPVVQTDENGVATVEFWNNSRCEHIYLSVEGVADDGRPIVLP